MYTIDQSALAKERVVADCCFLAHDSKDEVCFWLFTIINAPMPCIIIICFVMLYGSCRYLFVRRPSEEMPVHYKSAPAC
jgi:hypothetical protein